MNMYDKVSTEVVESNLASKEDISVYDTEGRPNIYESASAVALAGIYYLASTKAGAEDILYHLENYRSEIERGVSGVCATFTFGEMTESFAQSVADNAGVPAKLASAALDIAARSGYQQILAGLGEKEPKPEDVTKIMTPQRRNILKKLPVDLQIGYLLGDDVSNDSKDEAAALSMSSN